MNDPQVIELLNSGYECQSMPDQDSDDGTSTFCRPLGEIISEVDYYNAFVPPMSAEEVDETFTNEDFQPHITESTSSGAMRSDVNSDFSTSTDFKSDGYPNEQTQPITTSPLDDNLDTIEVPEYDGITITPVDPVIEPSPPVPVPIPPTNPNPNPEPNPEPVNFENQCQTNPDSLACLSVGQETQQLEIQEYQFEFDFEKYSLQTSAQCPSPIIIPIGSETVTLTYEPFCEFLTAIKPIIVAIGMLLATYIVSGASKE